MDAWFQHLTDPVNPGTFLKALEVWMNAASKPMSRGKPRGPGIYLTDIPINRSGMATTAFLKRIGVDRPQAYLNRLMNMGSVMTDEIVKRDYTRTVDGEFEVSDSLLKAIAVAKFSGATTLDIADVLAHAKRFDAETAAQ